jgi:peptide/nickel transport system substrate-binding protein
LIPAALKYWYYPGVQHYPYDPVKARAILDAAGWKPGPDGIRRKGNTRLSFELLLNQGSSVITDEMLTWVADMHDIGIDLELRMVDFASLSARTYTGKYDIIVDARGGIVDPDLTTILASSQMPPNGANTTYYSDPIVDRDLKLGLVTIDDAQRRKYYDQMQLELSKTLPIMPQYGRFAAMAYAPRLVFDPATTLQTPLGYYNVEDWRFAK